jgi:hypothetical protein
MMFAIFGTLLAAFILDHAACRRSALACLVASLCLCIYLFIWEIYSPDYGFKMPWLEVGLKQYVAPVRGG